MSESGGRLKALGPGLLFAAVSVGVSHLVQATSAGATYGLSLIWVVVVALILKWPLFEFGQRYATATGTSLLEGYRRQGRWSLVLYMLLTVGTMFTVLAAVTEVTVGMVVEMTGLRFGSEAATLVVWSAVIIGVAAFLLLIGRYPLLDKAIKVIMAVLAVSAILATVMAVSKLQKDRLFGPVDWSDIVHVGFIVSLVGWMPTGMDVSVWQSFWSLARRRQTGHAPTMKQTLFDFRFGYIGTALVAVMFLVLGTAVMYGPGEKVSRNPFVFSEQVVELFTKNLGEATWLVIVIAAFTTMFSTTLTVLDGFPRALALLMRRFRGPETPEELEEKVARRPAYWIWMGVMSAGALVIIVLLGQDLRDLIYLATVLSFATAPFLGALTYQAIMGPAVAEKYRPGRFLRCLALAGIFFLEAFLILYMFMKFF